MNKILRDAALGHHEAGRRVIPTAKNKAPACGEGWDRWFTAEQTEAEVRDLFSDDAHGLGLLQYPASKNVTLDFDGLHAREAWQETGLDLSGAARVVTQSGGSHFVFRTPADTSELDKLTRKVRLVKAKCDCKKNGEPNPCGVDLLVNGYAVAPPTPGYQEDPDYPLEAAGVIPTEIICFARSQQHSSLAHQNGDRERFNTAQALAGVPEGQRDETLFKLACKLRSADVPRDMAETLILEAARNCQPPFSERIALEKVERVYRRYEPNSEEKKRR